MGLIGDVETVAEGATGTWWIKLIPYVLSVAVACGLLYGAYSWAWHRGAHSRDGEVAALNLTIANVRTAEAQATSANLAHVRAKEAEHDQITKDKDDAYQAHISALSAAYDQRLRDYAKAHPSYAGGDRLPEVPDPARGFDATACREGFLCIPAETGFALMKAADRNTQQLVDLQDWVRAQAAQGM